MYLIFDTETTGVDKSKLRVVELGWLLVDGSKEVVKEQSYLIYPDNFYVPSAATKIHGITQSMLIRDGKPIKFVLQKFMEDLLSADYIVAHNIAFDLQALAKEFVLAGMENPLSNKYEICTMRLSTNFCKIQKKTQKGYKWPSLQELHLKLFANYFDGAHRAMSDVYACKECFFRLLDLNVINIPNQPAQKISNRAYSMNQTRRASKSESADRLKRWEHFLSQASDLSEDAAVEKTITPVVKPAVTPEVTITGSCASKPIQTPSNFAKKVNQFWWAVLFVILLTSILNWLNKSDKKSRDASEKNGISRNAILKNNTPPSLVLNQPPVPIKQPKEGEEVGVNASSINTYSIESSMQTSVSSQEKDEELVDGDSLNQKGIEKINAGKPEESVTYFLRAIKFSPHNAEILGNLAFAYYQLGDHNKALPYIEQSLRVNPKRGASWLHLGQIQAIHGNVEDAIYSFESYLRYSKNKKAAIGQLTDWSNGLYDGRYSYIREASRQALINESYLSN